MEVGIVEIDEDEVERRTTGKIASGGSDNPPGKGGSGGGPGGGSDGPSDASKSDAASSDDEFRPGISRMFTAFLLLVVLMTFGGLMAAYVVIATNKAIEWQPFALPIQVWLSTGVIIISSITYHFGQLSVETNDQPSAKKWFIATTVFGAAFISSQILAWMALVQRGLYLEGNPYAGFFYIITAVHAVHVLGGIAALGAILLRVWNPTQKPAEVSKRTSIAQVTGWYWHFMGALWIVLFIMLGFWK